MADVALLKQSLDLGTRRPLLVGPGLVCAAVGLIWVGLTVVPVLGGQMLVVALGAAAGYLGVDVLAKARFGAAVETDLWFAVAWLSVIVLLAVGADLLPLAEARDPANTLMSPSRLRPDLLSQHPFGTDTQGLDILGGIAYGARVSLQVSLLAVVVGTVVGGLVGIVAGYFGGRLDAATGLVTDTMLAFPPLVMLLAIVTIFEPSSLTIAFALATLGIPTYIRLTRAATMSISQREYVLAARSLGAKPFRIILRELLPNVVRPLLSYAFIVIPVLIVAEGSLSFLGVGIQRPAPSWGNMIAAAQGELETSPHMVFIPGGVMFVTVFAVNRVGDRVRVLINPNRGDR